jgi:hypothetical protein
MVTRLGLTTFLLIGNCYLTYAQSQVIADSGANLSFLPGGFASGNGCCSVVTADFNGDGKADIATVRGTAVVTITLWKECTAARAGMVSCHEPRFAAGM